jgi:hypothetical protein
MNRLKNETPSQEVIVDVPYCIEEDIYWDSIIDDRIEAEEHMLYVKRLTIAIKISFCLFIVFCYISALTEFNWAACGFILMGLVSLILGERLSTIS